MQKCKTIVLKCVSIMRLITAVKNPTEELTVHILSSLWSWDISLTLNMTYFSLHVILNAVKNPTEELTWHMLFTLVVGYSAYAQYDVMEW